jgi:transcriptional regulator with XRE-family HTH domain
VAESQLGVEVEAAVGTANDTVAARLREARERSGLSLRQLAHRIELSPSALSQIETGKSRPSVRTLYALVAQLNMSLDVLFDIPGRAGADADGAQPASFVAPEHLQPSARLQAGSPTTTTTPSSPVQRADERARLELDSGVQWERLTSAHDQLIEFLQVTYEAGSASNSNGILVQHSGLEYGVVLSGTFDVTIGFETYHLGPGDSISFSSDEPHLLANNSSEQAVAIWFVVGRRGGDSRIPAFDA